MRKQHLDSLSYSDDLMRLFPREDKTPMHINGTHAYDITFQVTEDCCMKCSYCLVAGTKITMQDYSVKNIEDIVEGDKVLGVCVGKNKILHTTIEDVKEVYVHYDDTLIITTEDGNIIECTKEHPFWTRTGWRQAENLKIGTELYYIKSSERYIFNKTKIINIIKGQEYVPVYNFATTNHTYIANNFLVHNCYQQNKSHNHMTFEVAKQFIDMLLAADERTNTYITSTNTDGVILEFIGGEPLMEIDLIDQIVDYFREQTFLLQHPWANRFRISMCSNGLLYFNPKVQQFIKKNNENLSFSVSIDGNKELHDSCRVDLEGNGTYDRALKAALDYSSVYDVSIGSKMTLAPGNIQYTFDAVKSLIENDYKTINLNCVFEKGWELFHAKILYEQLIKVVDYLYDNNLFDKINLSIFNEYVGKPWPSNDTSVFCGGAGLMLAIDYKGNIFPCLRYMESSLNGKQEPFIIGDIKNGINTLPIYKERLEILKKTNRRIRSDDKCFYCPIAGQCSSCIGYDYECFGTPCKRTTYICIMHQARVLANAYYFKKKAQKTGKNNNFKLNIPKDWALEIIGEKEYNKLI